MDGRHDGSGRVPQAMIAVAVLGLLLFVPPLLSLFDRRAAFWGVPLLMVYLFGAWALVIGLVAAVSRGSGRPPE